jgi:hypothetical protein
MKPATLETDMTATDIIAAIIKMHKDASFEEVQELIHSRAMVCDFDFIKSELAQHVSLNEQNAADYALAVMAAHDLDNTGD